MSAVTPPAPQLRKPSQSSTRAATHLFQTAVCHFVLFPWVMMFLMASRVRTPCRRLSASCAQVLRESLSSAAVASQSVFLKEQDSKVEMTPCTGCRCENTPILSISIRAPGDAVSASSHIFRGIFSLSSKNPVDHVANSCAAIQAPRFH